ncbi:LPS export ABC transporter periplasmic protein LptC [Myxosarcina sp. GI1]|uniref:LPS export ABC transporter periplasmic protein LptC n=1 Tax=Myxosarcina sp. GI1 TaxID=1541065 RepID=UPI00068C3E4F|nr:LPS export ABC transporter periplasmic protein LptC [Myxosarcina sp. GI1]
MIKLNLPIFLSVAKSLLLIVVWLSLAACQQTKTQTPSADAADPTERKDTQLTLNNAVWQQSNRQENTVWKIRAENAVYGKNKQTAQLENVTGNLLQDGKIILQLSAERGEVRDNGNLILLNDNIVATDTRNGGTISSDVVEWQPNENLLLIRQNLRGNRDKVRVTATEGRYYTDSETLELQDKVVVTTAEPALQLTSDRLTWNIAQNIINSEVPLQVVRYQDEIVSDRLVADRGMVDLANNTVTLASNIELISTNPQLQIATNSLNWNYQTRIINTEEPIQIIDRDNNLSVTGNSGEVDLSRNIAHLKAGSKSINNNNSAQLYAQELIWNLDTEVVEAIGSVVYQQSKPQLNVTGNKAEGKLTDNSIVVTGGNESGQVTSIIDDL